MSAKIRDLMIKKVITVDSDYTVKHAADIMNRYEVGCLVVLEKERVVGILTERDILKRMVAVARDPEKTFVGEVMSRPVIVVGPDVSLEYAVMLMFEHKIKKLPVMESHNGKEELVGLVTLTDIARVQTKLIRQLREHFELEGETPPKSMEKVINYYIV
jgi:CBS domain-containing protein